MIEEDMQYKPPDTTYAHPGEHPSAHIHVTPTNQHTYTSHTQITLFYNNSGSGLKPCPVAHLHNRVYRRRKQF